MVGEIVKDGESIKDIEDWERLAGPKKAEHWKDGRSAKETAKRWIEFWKHEGNPMPTEVVEILKSRPDFGEVQSWEAEPEAKLRFDEYRGEPRNTDIVVKANDTEGDFLIAVEAKADEPFGGLVKAQRKKAEKVKNKNLNSNALNRLN